MSTENGPRPDRRWSRCTSCLTAHECRCTRCTTTHSYASRTANGASTDGNGAPRPCLPGVMISPAGRAPGPLNGECRAGSTAEKTPFNVSFHHSRRHAGDTHRLSSAPEHLESSVDCCRQDEPLELPVSPTDNQRRLVFWPALGLFATDSDRRLAPLACWGATILG